MKSLLLLCPLLLFLLLASPIHATDKTLCQDPPGNNAIAVMLADTIDKIRPIMVTGNATFGIPVLDPYGPLPHINVDFANENIRLDIELDDVLIREISTFVICSLNLTLGFAQKLDLEVHLDELGASGSYKADGSLLGIFPVFGNGGFDLTVSQAFMTANSKITYNPISDHAKMKELHFDIGFQSLQMEMECILGCGDMADMVNEMASDIGKEVFDQLWAYIKPLLETNVLEVINTILKDIKISELIPKDEQERLPKKVNLLSYLAQRHQEEDEAARGLGNANGFMDLIFSHIATTIVDSGADPMPLPDHTLQFMENGVAKLYNGELTGLSSIHRSGTSSLDMVGEWIFLYTNFAFNGLKARCTGKVEVLNVGPVVDMSASVSQVSVYMMARKDLYGNVVDIDQFIITEFGKIDVEIDGLGLLDYLAPLGESVANAFHDVIVDLLQTTIADLIKDALQETPWPRNKLL
ncbi:uncharacterized protein LOC143022231 [Oratosquilla oratoria]|uniref:uncharacterized protein LOC143022231 n=1 Tax=Oratosquilla oratoria TaxID=337810 RepID=UPI003F76B20F